jgi:hypothetical protein
VALVEARRRVATPRRRPVAQARAVQRSDTIEGYAVGVNGAFAAIDDRNPFAAAELTWRAVRGCQVTTRALQPPSWVTPPGLRTHPLKALRSMLQRCDLGNWSDRRRSDQVHAHDADPYRLVRA